MVINFTFDTEYGSFSDALVLPDDHTFTDDDLEVMKQERLSNWIAIITPIEQVEEIIIEE